MMKMYVVSSEYQPLVEFNPNPGFRRLFLKNSHASIVPINVSTDDLKATFENAIKKPLIACKSKGDAQT